MKAGYGIRKPVENAFLVRERDHRRLLDLIRVMLTILPLAAVLLGYSWIHLQLTETSYGIEALQGKIEKLDENLRFLRLEAAELKTPARLEDRAVLVLGMRPPEFDEVLYWERLQ